MAELKSSRNLMLNSIYKGTALYYNFIDLMHQVPASREFIKLPKSREACFDKLIFDENTPVFMIEAVNKDYEFNHEYTEIFESRPFDNFLIEIKLDQHMSQFVAVSFHDFSNTATTLMNCALYSYDNNLKRTLKDSLRFLFTTEYDAERNKNALMIIPATGDVTTRDNGAVDFGTSETDSEADPVVRELRGYEPSQHPTSIQILQNIFALYNKLLDVNSETVKVKAKNNSVLKRRSMKFNANSDYIIIKNNPTRLKTDLESGQGVVKIAHNRRGHTRVYKSGKTIWIKPSKIHGGGGGKSYIFK
ncbi:hypothetical protein GLP37_21770 [Photobacterium phosphoreum]|uniref:hypothetical protein n=1 Tax=Photobacterium phosphoreum TaxID=659 RepID=UPI001E427FE1|nr:hypothetical protein [Photobacterium phosphoreum]MCD9504795.1 hypothetical protein [Photobacterium phosphoreum]